MNQKLKTFIYVGFTALALVVTVSVISQVSAEENEENEGLRLGQLKQATKILEKLDEGFGMRMDNVARERESAMIKPNGDFRITGVVVNSVVSSTNMLNGSLFGLSRDVSVSGAQIFGAGGPISLGDIMPGDKLVATGNFNRDTRAITVKQIHDLSSTGRSSTDIQAKIQSLIEIVRQLQEQLKALLHQ